MGSCYGFGATVLGDGNELWTSLRRDACPGCRPADWLITTGWQEMVWQVRIDHGLHPVPFDRRLEYRDDLMERLSARSAGWAVIRLAGGDMLLARRGDVEAGPYPMAAMAAQMGQAIVDAVREAVLSHP